MMRYQRKWKFQDNQDLRNFDDSRVVRWKQL